jgi:hypothetical protein
MREREQELAEGRRSGEKLEPKRRDVSHRQALV